VLVLCISIKYISVYYLETSKHMQNISYEID